MSSDDNNSNENHRPSESSQKNNGRRSSRVKIGSSTREYAVERCSGECVPGSGYWTSETVREKTRKRHDQERRHADKDTSQGVVNQDHSSTEQDEHVTHRQQYDELKLDEDFDRLCNYFTARNQEEKSKERRRSKSTPSGSGQKQSRRRQRRRSGRSDKHQSPSRVAVKVVNLPSGQQQPACSSSRNDDDPASVGPGHYTSASVRSRLRRNRDADDITLREHRRRRSFAESTIREQEDELDREFDALCNMLQNTPTTVASIASESPHTAQSPAAETANVGQIQPNRPDPSIQQQARPRPLFRWSCRVNAPQIPDINPLRSENARTTIVLVAVLVVLLCNWQRLGQYTEDFLRGFYCVWHVWLTSCAVSLKWLEQCASGADRWLETVKCDLADGLCQRFGRLCDERCSHLDRFKRYHFY